LVVAGDGTAVDLVMAEQVRLIRSIREEIPIAVIGDPAMRTAEDFVHRFRLAGYIPVTSTSEIAAAALRLMAAGGRYVPCKADATIAMNGRSDNRRELPAIIQEGEAQLTRRERAVLECLRRGLPNKLIAYDLAISIGTVKMHVHNIMAKLGVHNRTEAALSRGESIERICGLPDRNETSQTNG
jgi:DNA-binding NarL/FixJ family response regulator